MTPSTISCPWRTQILHQMVTEMNAVSNARSLAQHRKVAGSFRDGCLHQIFKISLDTLSRLQTNQIACSDEAQKGKIREHSLNLALVCLGYDFIGTTLDEASEELGTIQVPQQPQQPQQQKQPSHAKQPLTAPPPLTAQYRCRRAGGQPWRRPRPCSSTLTCLVRGAANRN